MFRVLPPPHPPKIIYLSLLHLSGNMDNSTFKMSHCVPLYPQTQPNLEHHLNALKLLGRSLCFSTPIRLGLQAALQMSWQLRLHTTCRHTTQTRPHSHSHTYTRGGQKRRRNMGITLRLSCRVTTRKYGSRSENVFTWRFNFITTESKLILITLGKFVAHPIPALHQNLGCHKLKDDHEVETVVTRWMITEDSLIFTAKRKARPSIR